MNKIKFSTKKKCKLEDLGIDQAFILKEKSDVIYINNCVSRWPQSGYCTKITLDGKISIALIRSYAEVIPVVFEIKNISRLIKYRLYRDPYAD